MLVLIFNQPTSTLPPAFTVVVRTIVVNPGSVQVIAVQGGKMIVVNGGKTIITN